MNLELLFGSATGSLPRLEELLVRMLLAAALGAVVSHRPWRWLMTELPSPSVEGAQAQALLAAAGALTAVVIGDHPARAFGLVGLGSFVRFRSVISDPRDNVVMLMTIAIGMAAGIGRPAMAVGATACAALVMVAFDLTESRGSRVTKVAIISENPPVVRVRMAELFPSGSSRARARELPDGIGQGQRQDDRAVEAARRRGCVLAA